MEGSHQSARPPWAIIGDTQFTYLASASGHNRNDICIRLSRVHDVYDGLQLACTELIVVEALTEEAPSATRNTGKIHSRL